WADCQETRLTRQRKKKADRAIGFFLASSGAGRARRASRPAPSAAFGLRGPDGALAPAAAQHFVERDEVGEPRQAGVHQHLLRAVERALGIEHAEVVVDALPETLLGKIVGALVGGHELFLGEDLAVQGAS